MDERGFNRRAQLTIFVIFGVILFIGIIAFFMLLPLPDVLNGSSYKSPLDEIRPCLEKSLKDVLPEFQEKGFYFEPSRTLIYQGKNVSYHCFTSAKKQICSRNDAQSKSRIELELKNKISDSVETCFDDYVSKNKVYDIFLGQTNLWIEILPSKIHVRTRKDLRISRGDSEDSDDYNNFDVSINSPLWDFIVISNEILNQEVSCNCPMESCTADVVSLMKAYKDYKITFYMGGSDDRVYTIEDFYDNNQFKFAVKNCVKTP